VAKTSEARQALGEARARAKAVAPPAIFADSTSLQKKKAAPTNATTNKAVTIKYIKVYGVSLEPKKQGTFCVTFNNSSLGILVKFAKEVWEAMGRGEECYSMMMHKTRRAVYQKKEEHKIRIDIGLSKEFMSGTDWPWKFIWSEVEK